MFQKKTVNGVEFYTSSLLSHVPHGFSTRTGGVSEEPYLRSLNLGYGKEDGEEKVRENRKRFSDAVFGDSVSAAKNEIFTMGNQIHSDVIITADSDNADKLFDCDGFVTSSESVRIGIKTAECVPILLSSDDGRFVAAVHAGWKGTALGIASLAVEKLLSLGAEKATVKAALGPSISPEVYRVGDDFGDLLFSAMKSSKSPAVRENSRSLSRDFLTPFPDGIHCDLWSLNREILILSGLDPENIDVSGICTFRNEEFYSHRRQGSSRGVMASVIAPAVPVE